MNLTRRSFVKLLTTAGAGAVISQYKGGIIDVVKAAKDQGVKLVWIQGLCDTSCSVSLLQASDPDIYDAIKELTVKISFHPTLMPEFGDEAINKLKNTDPDILVLEGSIPTGDVKHACLIGEKKGNPFTLNDWIENLVPRTKKGIVGFGTCASFGGIPGARDFTGKSPTNAVGLHEYFKMDKAPTPPVPVLNIPGCPGHPDWLLSIVAGLLLGAEIPTDDKGRPTKFFSHPVHDGCQRRDSYDEREFAESFKETDIDKGKCLLRLGCRGPLAPAACTQTLWNGGTSVCMDAGAPCIGCMHPGFPDEMSLPTSFYEEMRPTELHVPEKEKPVVSPAVFAGLSGGVAAIGGAAAYRATQSDDESGQGKKKEPTKEGK